MTDQKNLTFDVAVCERLKAAFTDIFLNHPEVKCLAASICWNGELNEANINHGVWLSADGPVQSPDGVIGSVYQTLRLLDEQMGRCGQLLAALREQVTITANEVIQAREELKKIKGEIAEGTALREATKTNVN